MAKKDQNENPLAKRNERWRLAVLDEKRLRQIIAGDARTQPPRSEKCPLRHRGKMGGE